MIVPHSGTSVLRSLHWAQRWFPPKVPALRTTPTDATLIHRRRKISRREKLLPCKSEVLREPCFSPRGAGDLVARVARQGDAQVQGIGRNQEQVLRAVRGSDRRTQSED